MLATVFIPNIIAMVLLLVLFFSASHISRQAVLLDSKLFLIMAGLNLFQCAGEMLAYSIDGIAGLFFHVAGLAINSLLFIVNICFSYVWVVYADYKIFQNIEQVKQRAKRLAIPAGLVIAGSLINLFMPVFFQITPDNHYQRTALFFLPYLVTYFYLIWGMVFIYRHKSQARKYVFLPAAVFLAPIFLGSIVQFCFYGFSTVWVGVAIGLVAIYVNLQNETSYTDALSGLYTRIYMYQYLESTIRKSNSHKKVAGILLDIDQFKAINDTYGHIVGDDVIRSAGNIFLTSLDKSCIAARFGGDEFIVLQEVESEKDLHKTIQIIEAAEQSFNQSSEKDYLLHFSKGYSLLEPKTDTIETFLSRMDKAMYEDKHAHQAAHT